MKDWLKRFFFYLGIASVTFLLTWFFDLLYNGKELVFTAKPIIFIMKYFYIFILSIFLLLCCSSKKAESTILVNNPVNDTITYQNTDTNKVYTVVEQMPVFPGGESEMMRFISENLRYPVIPDDKIMENLRTVVRFTITKTGEIKDIEPTKPQYKGTILTDSLTQLIKRMPRWTPGKQDGKEVDVYFTIPLHVSPKR